MFGQRRPLDMSVSSYRWAFFFELDQGFGRTCSPQRRKGIKINDERTGQNTYNWIFDFLFV